MRRAFFGERRLATGEWRREDREVLASNVILGDGGDEPRTPEPGPTQRVGS
jgi:hypothetical protein